MLSAELFRDVQLFVTLWTVICQIPLSLEFFQQEYWSGLPFPTPEDLSNPGIKPQSLRSPVLACRFFTTVPEIKFNTAFLCFFFCKLGTVFIKVWGNWQRKQEIDLCIFFCLEYLIKCWLKLDLPKTFNDHI